MAFSKECSLVLTYAATPYQQTTFAFAPPHDPSTKNRGFVVNDLKYLLSVLSPQYGCGWLLVPVRQSTCVGLFLWALAQRALFHCACKSTCSVEARFSEMLKEYLILK